MVDVAVHDKVCACQNQFVARTIMDEEYNVIVQKFHANLPILQRQHPNHQEENILL